MTRKHPETDIAVSFVGPSCGNLILRLTHRATRPGITLAVLGTSFTLTIPESLTTDDINLHAIGNSPSQVSFRPNTRNNLIFKAPMYTHDLQRIQLLDEHGHPYQHNTPATEFDALSVPCDRESS
jgi:hypothetical protein